jgi:hypothetical protein
MFFLFVFIFLKARKRCIIFSLEGVSCLIDKNETLYIERNEIKAIKREGEFFLAEIVGGTFMLMIDISYIDKASGLIKHISIDSSRYKARKIAKLYNIELNKPQYRNKQDSF